MNHQISLKFLLALPVDNDLRALHTVSDLLFSLLSKSVNKSDGHKLVCVQSQPSWKVGWITKGMWGKKAHFLA